MNEIEIEKLLKSKEVSAFQWVYDKYAPSLYGIILKLSPDSSTASEILEKSFKKIWSEIESYNSSHNKLFTWMFGITMNQCSELLCLSKRTLLNKLMRNDPATFQFNHINFTS